MIPVFRQRDPFTFVCALSVTWVSNATMHAASFVSPMVPPIVSPEPDGVQLEVGHLQHGHHRFRTGQWCGTFHGHGTNSDATGQASGLCAKAAQQQHCLRLSQDVQPGWVQPHLVGVLHLFSFPKEMYKSVTLFLGLPPTCSPSWLWRVFLAVHFTSVPSETHSRQKEVFLRHLNTRHYLRNIAYALFAFKPILLLVKNILKSFKIANKCLKYTYHRIHHISESCFKIWVV